MKEIIEKIKELEKLADNTDSKKEDFEYRQQIRELKRKLQESFDGKLNEFPAFIPIKITLNKVVNVDTFDFKNWIRDWVEDNHYDVDLMKEFRDYFDENFYVDDYVDSGDYQYTLEV